MLRVHGLDWQFTWWMSDRSIGLRELCGSVLSVMNVVLHCVLSVQEGDVHGFCIGAGCYC